MPDANGHFKGISVPELPWQKSEVGQLAERQAVRNRELAIRDEGRREAKAWAEDFNARRAQLSRK